MKRIFLSALVLIFVLAGCVKEQTFHVFMAGDSTMSDKDPGVYPETGWGQVLPDFFDSTKVVVENDAKNGRSSKSFISEGRWDSLINRVVPDSYVFIQFGHNDERPSKGPDRYSTIPEFKDHLRKYVKDVIDKKANPILLTPIVRRKFGDDGKLENTHLDYPDATRSVAKEMNVPLIDLTALSAKIVEAKGDSLSKSLYNWVEPGHKNYPDGKQDDTHFSPEGAKVMAGLVVDAIKEMNLPLAQALKQGENKRMN
jgi:lysophospholipase L1-like esterase